MITICFEIELKEPMLATAVEGDPNSAVSLPYIPGSLIRGALANRYLQSQSIADLAADSRSRRLFFDGEIRYLNAYPADENGKRALPTPFSWYKEKSAGERFTTYDLSVEEPDEEDLTHPVRVEKPFCILDEAEASLYDPRKRIAVHTQRDRRMGRATEGSGAVFQYEALAPGQTFAGFVLCPDTDAADTVEQLLTQGDLLLGGSRSAGYGLAEIREVRRMDNGWTESSGPTRGNVQAGESFSLILLSDAILRDDRGHSAGFLTPEILAARLSIRLTLLHEHTFARSGVVGGFNRKWGLPLPQVTVARAGSVYIFRAEGAVPAGKLASLFEAGIGERRVDGFGRVAVHWNLAEKVEVTEPAKGRLPLPAPLANSGESAALARRMATRMLRRRLDAQLAERINKLHVKGEIRNNQLANIRTLVRGAWLNGNARPIIKHLDEVKEVARKQIQATRVNDKPLDQWLRDVLQDSPNNVWAMLFESPLHQEKLPAVGGIYPEWDEALAGEYALRLIDGVLSRALEERRSGR